VFFSFCLLAFLLLAFYAVSSRPIGVWRSPSHLSSFLNPSLNPLHPMFPIVICPFLWYFVDLSMWRSTKMPCLLLVSFAAFCPPPFFPIFSQQQVLSFSEFFFRRLSRRYNSRLEDLCSFVLKLQFFSLCAFLLPGFDHKDVRSRPRPFFFFTLSAFPRLRTLC